MRNLSLQSHIASLGTIAVGVAILFALQAAMMSQSRAQGTRTLADPDSEAPIVALADRPDALPLEYVRARDALKVARTRIHDVQSKLAQIDGTLANLDARNHELLLSFYADSPEDYNAQAWAARLEILELARLLNEDLPLLLSHLTGAQSEFAPLLEALLAIPVAEPTPVPSPTPTPDPTRTPEPSPTPNPTPDRS